jgi:DNA-3-methyladenine glycosylase I
MKTTTPSRPAVEDSRRCRWARDDALLADYHDLEWGRPIKTDAGHLERMALEIFQCGLSWRIVLVKRPALREAFAEFDVEHVAGMTARHVERLMSDASIIRNRKKIEATIHNARRFVELGGANGSYLKWFDAVRCDTPTRRRGTFKLFHETFRFMGPETTKCYLMGVGRIPPPHERRCWMNR